MALSESMTISIIEKFILKGENLKRPTNNLVTPQNN